MKVPEFFTIKSKTGIFEMRNIPEAFLPRRYIGEANGVKCTVKFYSINGFKAILESSNKKIINKKKSCRGQIYNLDGFVSAMSYWIDSVAFENALNNDETAFIKTKNGKIAYHGYNTHLNGTPVLFVHGGPGDCANTEKPRKMMLNNPVYCYDQLGCGNSDSISGLSEWNHENYFDELNEFITLMNFKKVILIGASWGAGLIAGYATKYGCEKIEKMILVSPFLSSKVWEHDQISNLETISENDKKQIMKYINGEISKNDCVSSIASYLSKYLFTRECNKHLAEEASKMEPNEVFKALCGDNDFVVTGNMKEFNLVPELDKITVPALLMCGDSDEVRVETLISFAEKIKDSRISVVPFAGHALSHEQFEIYAQTIIDFLNE